MIVASIEKNTIFLPLNSILANGYAASADKIKFSNTVNPCGIIVGGYAKMFSLTPFKDVDNNHIKGKIDNKDTKINIKCIENFLLIFLNIMQS